MRRGSLSLELIMCGEGVRSILLLLLVAIYLETIYIYVYDTCLLLCGVLWECFLCSGRC